MCRKPGLSVLTKISLWMLLIVVVPAALAQTGNLWIDTSGGSCTRQSTPGAYVDGQACSSMQAALTAAQAGDTVIIKNGTYGSQSLSSGAKSSAVDFVAETSGQVLVGSLSINVDKVHVTGVIASGTGESRGELNMRNSSSTPWTDIVVDGFQGKSAFIAGTGITIKNSEFGNASACNNAATEDAFRFWSWGPSSSISPSNDALINSSVHDWSAGSDGVCGGTSAAGIHPDGIQVYSGGSNITLDGNKFYGNPSSNIQVGGGSLSNWTIQNNYFGQTQCCNNIAFGQASCSGTFLFRNNVVANGAAYGVINNGGTPTCNIVPDVSSNIWTVSVSVCMASGSMSGGNNVFVPSGGTTCASNAKRCTPSWLNGAPSKSNNYDIRLASTDSCAKDAGNPSSYAPTDMFATLRPKGSAPDAGAFEVNSSGGSVGSPSALRTVVR